MVPISILILVIYSKIINFGNLFLRAFFSRVVLFCIYYSGCLAYSFQSLYSLRFNYFHIALVRYF